MTRLGNPGQGLTRGDKMRQSGITRLFVLFCIAVLFAAYGIGLGIRQIRFAGFETQASAAVKPEKPADKFEPDADEVVADTETSFEPSEELAEEPSEEAAEEFAEGAAEEPSEEVAEEFAGRPEFHGGRRMMGEEMRERIRNMAEEEAARMQLEETRAWLDEENSNHIQEMWSTLPEEARERIRNIQERWPTMSEEERDYYREMGHVMFGGGRTSGGR